MWNKLIERNQATDELVEIQDRWQMYKSIEKWKQGKELSQDEALSVCHYLFDVLQDTPQFYRLSEIRKIYEQEPTIKLLKNLKPLVESLLDDVMYSLLQKLKIKIRNLQDNALFEALDKPAFEAIAKAFNEKARNFVRAYKANLADKLQSLYIQETTADGRNRIFRMMLVSQNQLIDAWGDLLPQTEQVIDVRRLMLADLDLMGLDLQRLHFENNQSSQIDLRGIICRPDQFITVYGLAQQKIDDELYHQIFSAKVKFINEKLSNANELLQHTQLMLEALDQFRHLACRGELPSIENISDVTLRAVINLALQSFYINTLPDKHPASHANISSELTKLETMPLKDIKDMLIELLKHRNFILPADVVAFNQQQKVVLVFEAISYIGDILNELTVIYRDLPEKFAADIVNLLHSVTEQYHELKSRKQPLISRYQQELINNLLTCINDPQDEQLSMTPELRLETALNTARGRPQLSIDLRAFDITLLPINKTMQIDDVCLLVTPDQEVRLPVTWQAQRYSSFLAAITAGDINKLSLLRNSNPTLDINHRDEAGRTPLMKACIENKPDVVRFLLQNGADCHIQTKEGWTIIEGVARLVLIDVAAVLIEFGAITDFWSLIHLGRPTHEIEPLLTPGCVNEADYDGHMPLHIAVNRKHIHLISWLVQKSALIDAVNPRQQTPLHLAVCVAADIAVEVFKLGGTVTLAIVRAACENKQDNLAKAMRAKIMQIDLYTAMYLNETDTIHSIVNMQANAVQADGFTPLAIACGLGKVDLVNWLIEEKGADINLICKFATPGMHAIQNNQMDVIQLLIRLGISLTESIKGMPPLLFFAVSQGATEIVRVMLQPRAVKNQHPIDVNFRYLERTPLLVAAYKGDLEIVDLLLQSGADPLLKDIEGNMPLHLAAKEGFPLISLALTQAMLGRPNNQGKTPALLAGEQQHRKIVELLTPRAQCEQHLADRQGSQGEGSPDINAGIHRMFAHKPKRNQPRIPSSIQSKVNNEIVSETCNL